MKNEKDNLGNKHTYESMHNEYNNDLVQGFFNSKLVSITKIQEIISESSIFVNRNVVKHIDAGLLVQNLQQFIAIVKDIKKLKNENQADTLCSSKPILLYSDNKYAKLLIKVVLKKLKMSSNSNLEQFIDVGGVKELISSVITDKKYSLVIFTEMPYKKHIKFCIVNRIYMLSIFTTSYTDDLMGFYKIPLELRGLKYYFWLLILLDII